MIHVTMKNNYNTTCVLLTVLCNQPEAFALDLGDDQSRYLLDIYESLVNHFVGVQHFA